MQNQIKDFMSCFMTNWLHMRTELLNNYLTKGCTYRLDICLCWDGFGDLWAFNFDNLRQEFETTMNIKPI